MEVDEVDEIVSLRRPSPLILAGSTRWRHGGVRQDIRGLTRSLPTQVDQLEHEARGKAKLMAQVRAYRQEVKGWKTRVVRSEPSHVVTGSLFSGGEPY